MKIYYSDHFLIPLPNDHRFPMPKYALLRERVWQANLTPPEERIASVAAQDEDIYRVHTPGYWQKVVNGTLNEKELRRIGFPWSPALVERTRRSVGGTLGACRAALQEGLAANLAGGTHHAYPEHGEGYCVLNDVAIAARAMQAEGRARRVVVIDCDVHQGNGTAAIFAGDDSVYTFSVHGAKNFPFDKASGSLDIALPDGSGDDEFLEAVQIGVETALFQSRADLAIYIAGADPFAGDRLGRLKMTKPGLLERDRVVLEQCREAGLPVAVVLGGGYAHEIQDTIDIHFQTIALAASFATPTASRADD